jgi:hypothetical protein
MLVRGQMNPQNPQNPQNPANPANGQYTPRYRSISHGDTCRM